LRISDLLGATLSPDGLWDGAFKIVGGAAPVFEPGGTRRAAIFLGQSMFTPKNLAIRPPDPYDRPYAGWFYAGTSLLQETGSRMLENAELDFGVVGPGDVQRQLSCPVVLPHQRMFPSHRASPHQICSCCLIALCPNPSSFSRFLISAACCCGPCGVVGDAPASSKRSGKSTGLWGKLG